MGRACQRKPGVNERADAWAARYRLAAVAVLEAVGDINLVAACFNVHRSTLSRWASKSAAGEHMGNAPIPGRPRKLTAEMEAAMRKIGGRRETGSATLAARAFEQQFGIRISKASALRVLTSGGHAFRVFRPAPKLTPSRFLADWRSRGCGAMKNGTR